MATVLIIEDEAGIRQNLATLLRLEGFETLEAENGRIGLDMARAHLPALILSDVMMPELDGYGLLEQLRSDPLTRTIPLIFLTALADRVDTRRGMSLGADDYLSKPFTRSEVLDAISATLKRNHTLENASLKQTISILEDVGRIAQHDLKTPLSSLAAAPALLRAGRVVSAGEEEVLSAMESAANRAIRMVNLSMDIYRMEVGTYTFRPVLVNLSSLVLTVLRDLAVHAQSKFITFDLSALSPHVHVNAEDALCYSIIANLAKNAVEAAPEQSAVAIALVDGPTVNLRIHNQGCVPEILRARFFDKYASAGKVGGTGLGTYSSHLLARVQGGSLTMETSDTSGTAITLTLSRGAPPSATVAESAITVGAIYPQSVLVVDDDAFNLMILCECLPQPPLQVQTALNGRIALEAIGQSRPDFIIMDIEMPVMGGVEALVLIRQRQSELGQEPSVIIAYSGNDDAASHSRYLQLGFDRCLPKPCNREELLAALRLRPH